MFTEEFVFDLQRFKTIENSKSNKLLSGTSGDDYISNYGEGEDEEEEEYGGLYGGFNVTIQAGAGNDYIYNDAENVTISGGAGNDEIENSEYGHRAKIDGGAGNDDIYVMYSHGSTIDGGAGNDYIYNSAYYVTINAGAGNDTVTVSSGDYMSINGDAGNDLIKGQYLNWYDTINGGDGNDTISGFGQGASINGGAGADRISLGSTYSKAQTVKGGTGNDTIYGASDDSVGNLYQYTSGDGNDKIYNFNSNSTLQIGGGTSTYSSQKSGSDIIVTVGDGKITLVGVSSANIKGTKVSKLVTLTSGNDIYSNSVSGATISALAGKDSISNYSDKVSISGGDGADTIYNSSTGDNSTISGGAGNDTIEGYYADYSIINAGDGNDKILDYGSAYASINAGAGNDVISLRSVSGFIYKHTVKGGTGNDTIYSNSLASESDGGSIYQYTSGDGNDKIYNWTSFDTLQIGDGTGSYSSQKSGSNIIVTVGDGKITLVGVSSANIKGTKVSKLVTLTSGNDIYSNSVSGATISALAGKDSISNSASSVSIASGDGNDSIYNSAYYVTINAGAGNDTVTVSSGDYMSINGGAGNDLIKGQYLNWYDTINGGDGNDTISGFGQGASINGGAGADRISLGSTYSKAQTVKGGTGNDTIYGASDDSVGNLYQYTTGDGNDKIYNFNSNSTLQIGGGTGTYSSQKSGSDIIVTVGDGKITLVGVSSANIKGTKVSTESNTWKISGTTATYGTSSKTLVTVTGVKSLSGISLSGKVVTVAASSLNQSKVTVSDGYTLKLASDVTKPSTKKTWSLSGSTATYKQTTAAGYTLASDSKSITYTKKATSTLATVKGATSKNGFIVNGKTIKLATSSLSSKVSVSGSYAFEFASDYKSAKISGSGSNDSITTAGQKITIASGAGNDYIIIKGKTSTINAGAGNDTIVNSGADVTIRGGKGNDNLTGGSGKDTFVYSEGDGNDVITNYDEADRIRFESGTAKISTNNNDVIFTVGSGKITVKGGKGKTITYFESGKELVYPEKKSSDVVYNEDGTAATLKKTYNNETFVPSDYEKNYPYLETIDASAVTYSLKITGNKRANKIIGTGDDDIIHGGDGKDTILGGYGNDKLYGDIGNDSLWGGADDDSLWGDEGNDTLTGGDGDDTFIYKSGDGKDTIDYFETGDIIIILDSNVGNPNVNASGDVIYKIDNGLGQLTIKNAKDKYIQPVDGKGNRLPVHNPNS